MATGRRRAAAAASALAVSLLVLACGSSSGPTGDPAAVPAATPSGLQAPAGEIDCSGYEQFGDLSGTTVTIYYGEMFDPVAEAYETAWALFTTCTAATVMPESTESVQTDLVARVRSGDAPDLALFPQVALLESVRRDTGAVLPVFDEAQALAQEGFTADWLDVATFDGALYGFPHGRASSKSLVWYSPAAFAERGYSVPQTWDELMTLSEQIVADHPGGTVKPWCAGIENEEASGWPMTDWVEDVMLRQQGPQYYDDWVDHTVPFNAPESLAVWETVGSVLRNPAYVNGGFGDVASIATTSPFEAGKPILDRECYLMKGGSFLELVWPQGLTVAEDGDVFAFYFPAESDTPSRPVLVAADYVAAFADRPEVRAFMAFLASEDFHNAVVPDLPTFVSPHLGLDVEALPPLRQAVVEQFRDPRAVIRVDGSDLMPGEVGAGTFWTESVRWIAEGADTQDVLDTIEASWPS
jgi:alpha-glucoside transport system substrate-binding protein